MFFVGASWQAWGAHLLVAALAFVLLFAMYFVGAMGGGDVKLGSVVFLWAGPALALQVLVIIAWLGGIIAALGWLFDRKSLQKVTLRPWRIVSYGLSAKRGVPYGVALCAGGWYVLGQYYLALGVT